MFKQIEKISLQRALFNSNIAKPTRTVKILKSNSKDKMKRDDIKVQDSKNKAVVSRQQIVVQP
jgi:hypothetical protein